MTPVLHAAFGPEEAWLRGREEMTATGRVMKVDGRARYAGPISGVCKG